MNDLKKSVLTAGDLCLEFENGFLRYIKLGQKEIVRMIYFALRDENWGTIPHRIENLQVKEKENSFKIQYEAKSQHPIIDFEWQCSITGENNTIQFEIDGQSHSKFLRNRIGFCVLHPIKECKGKPVVITHADKSKTTHRFPEYISPDQPFKNITSMEWSIDEARANIDFEGDLFECEDQRNWLDASYKTYCTPLDLPFPVQVENGERIWQKVCLVVEGSLKAEHKIIPELKQLDTSYPMPAIGLEANTNVLSSFAVSHLRKLQMSHLRVEADLYRKDWQEDLNKKLDQAGTLNVPVELVLFPSNDLPDDFMTNFREERVIRSIILLDHHEPVIGPEKTATILPKLRTFFKDLPIGIGTNFYFTELNRNRPSFKGFDFLSFSSNPQVHAFDDLSIFETAVTFTDVLKTAQFFSNGLPVHVSPVTLKPRSNPDATGELTPDQKQKNRIDTRQRKTLAAQWWMIAFKYLAQGGSSSVTAFQTVGEEGIMMSDQESIFDFFPARPDELFPVYDIFRMLGQQKGSKVIGTESSHPQLFDGMLFETSTGRKLLVLTNFCNHPLAIKISERTFELKAREIRQEFI